MRDNSNSSLVDASRQSATSMINYVSQGLTDNGKTVAANAAQVSEKQAVVAKDQQQQAAASHEQTQTSAKRVERTTAQKINDYFMKFLTSAAEAGQKSDDKKKGIMTAQDFYAQLGEGIYTKFTEKSQEKTTNKKQANSINDSADKQSATTATKGTESATSTQETGVTSSAPTTESSTQDQSSRTTTSPSPQPSLISATDDKQELDAYKTLGLSRDATSAEIQKAFCVKAVVSLSQSEDDREGQQALAAAYNQISTPEKQAAYNEKMQSTASSTPKPSFGGS